MLNKIGYEHIRFEEPIFKHYDMFLFASRRPIEEVSKEDQIKTLTSKSYSKMILALLDLADSKSVIQSKLNDAEKDRSKRLEVIQKQGQFIGEINSERNILQAQLVDLQKHFKAVESDRVARLEVIQEQGRRFGLVESERNNLKSQLADLQDQFEAVESDRAARLEVIHKQAKQLELLETEINNLKDQLNGAIRFLNTITKTKIFKIISKLKKTNWFKHEYNELLKILKKYTK